jgi:hypothetical protein
MRYNQFKKSFFDPKVNNKKLVSEIKHRITSFTELQKFIRRYRKELKSANTLLDNSLYGRNPLPKKYEDLNKGFFHYYPESVVCELNWVVASFSKFSSEINLFLKLKEQYEDEFFKGMYSNARQTLVEIENEICISFWTIENKFLLDEYEYGTEENWNTKNSFLRNEINPLVRAFSDMFSLRSEKNVPFYQYNNEIEGFLNANKALEEKRPNFNQYFRFRANFLSMTSYSNYEFFLHEESGASIIDKYLTFKRVCTHLILEENHQEEVFTLLREVFDLVEDSSIRNLLLYDIKDTSIPIYKNDIEFVKLVDLYTNGQYDKVILEIESYFTNNKCGELQILDLYTKSLCECGLTYQKISIKESILDDVGQAMHDVLMKAENTEDAFMKLANYAYSFSSSRHGVFLYNFVSSQFGLEQQIDYRFLYTSSSTFLTPMMIASSIGNSKKHLLKLEELKNSISLKLISAEYNLEDFSLNVKEQIPSIKSRLYRSRYLMGIKLYQEAKEVLLELMNQKDISIIAEYELYSNLFKCYFIEKEYREAIKLFVSVNFHNPHLTKQMNYDQILEGVIKGKFKNVGVKSDLIELPIFFKINSNDKIRIKQSLELFLRSVECTRPSEFIVHINDFSKSNSLFFLKDVCSTEILQLSKMFDSTFAVYEERITICKYLTEFDSNNSNRYKEEIADLTQKNTISKVIGGIDERKIYVNEDKLKRNIKNVEKHNVFNNESLSIINEDSFNRYIKLNNFVKNNNKYRSLKSLSLSLDENGELEFNHEDSIVETLGAVLRNSFLYYSPDFEIFSTFFLYIRDLFVSNKESGLDTYLSTKIRHGTLPNHLRSIFESSHLVTSQSNNSYVSNEYWKNKLDLKKSNEEVVQNLLSDFSKKVDAFSKKIKDDSIQCRVENEKVKTMAEFDYSYNKENLMALYVDKFQSIQDINEFIESSFQELWSRTEIILDRIRRKFIGNYKGFYLGYLENLEKELLEKFDRSEVNELLSNITICRTEIQYKLKSISEWFRRSESSYEGNYKISVLAQTSIEITKNIHPSYSFEIDTKFESSATIKGEYHEHFIDMLNNCLFNMIAHSSLDSSKLGAVFRIQEKGGNIVLTFINKVDNSEIHTSKLEEIKKGWLLIDSNIAQERGTGFPKVKKIISSDLNRNFSSFDFSKNEQEITIKLEFELKDL